MLRIDQKEIQDLLISIKNGDESAFEEFFHIYQPVVSRFLYRYTGDNQISDDILQDTFIKLWMVRETLDISSSPVALLFRIARNLALNAVTRRPAHQPIYGNDEILVSYCLNPDKEYENAFLMDDFQKAINTLPERCRAIFLLSRYEDMSYSEIAESLEISLQTVKNQMSKAIAILKKRLSSHLD